MSILITGATGYIGSHLTRSLIEQGESVRILCRTKPTQSFYQHPNVEFAIGDITHKQSVEAAMQKIKQVYHLAAYARLWANQPSTFYHINVLGTNNVLNAAAKANIEKMVYTSTAGVIGPSIESVADESLKRYIPFFNAYEETKAMAEELVMEQTAKGMDISIVNPARVYGPGSDTGSNPVTKIVEWYMKGKWRIVPGSGDDIGSYCYIDDVVQGHLAAMAKGKKGERYIFGGVNCSFNELLDTINKITGQQRQLLHIPFPLLKGVSHLFVIWSSITGKAPLMTPDWIARYDYNWALNSNKAERDLGYQIRPLREGLEKTISWLRENRM